MHWHRNISYLQCNIDLIDLRNVLCVYLSLITLLKSANYHVLIFAT